MFKFGCLGLLLGGLWGIMFYVFPFMFLGWKMGGQWGIGMLYTVPLGWLLGLGVGLVMGKYRRWRFAMNGAALGALSSVFFLIGARYAQDPLAVYVWMFLALPPLMVVGTVLGARLQPYEPEPEVPDPYEEYKVYPGEKFTLK